MRVTSIDPSPLVRLWENNRELQDQTVEHARRVLGQMNQARGAALDVEVTRLDAQVSRGQTLLGSVLDTYA